MSGEVNGRYITWAMPLECDRGHKTRITYQAGPDGLDECLCCRDEDGDAERAALQAEVKHLRRGIEAYREEYDCHKRDGHRRLNDCHPRCVACEWEHEEATRDER